MNPTIFISSSYFNLKTGRNEISKFCENMGYDSMLSEKIDIAHASDLLLDESCCNSVQLHADMLVLIIGGRYNLPTSEFRDKVKLKEFHERYESITLKEYKCAQEKQIPIYIFINRDVMTEYKTYSKQKELNFVTKDTPYAIVESVNVFLFIDKILSQTINNQYQLFNNYTDIENWLRVQWAETFKEFLTSKRDKRISKEDEKLYNYKTYDNSDEAFSDLYKKINLEAENKSKIGNSPFEFNLKGISFAMLHSNLPKCLCLSKSIHNFN